MQIAFTVPYTRRKHFNLTDQWMSTILKNIALAFCKTNLPGGLDLKSTTISRAFLCLLAKRHRHTKVIHHWTMPILLISQQTNNNSIINTYGPVTQSLVYKIHCFPMLTLDKYSLSVCSISKSIVWPYGLMMSMIDVQLEDEQLWELCIYFDSVRSDPLIELGRDLFCIYYTYNAILMLLGVLNQALWTILTGIHSK